MRKLLLLSFLIIAVIAHARQISEGEAASIASEFLNSATVRQTPAKAGVRRAKAPNAANAETAPFYVYNADDNQGFVIISGDDRANKILGYSNKGNFDYDNMPPQLNAMLEQYEEQIKNIPANIATHESWKASTRVSEEGGVLLETANWGQGAPYNLDCPEGCVTGCVATAMAIIMKYYGWPQRGRGSNCNPYDPQRGNYSFDTEYDWKNALTDYSRYGENPNFYTQDQISAVSKIMHDCTTSIESIFMTGGMTSADDHDCAYALRNFFNYDGNIGHTYINNIDTSGDNALGFVKSELDSGRPVLMSGAPVVGYSGHAWVIDGYDDTDMVHINWGWDGSGNGYYDYPIALGYQTSKITYNIKPGDSWVEFSPWEVPVEGSLNIDVEEVKQNQYFNAYCYLIDSSNIFHHPDPEPICTGALAVALTDADGNIKQILREITINNWYNDRLKGSSGFTGLRVTSPIDATDRITLVSKPNGFSEWLKFGKQPFAYTSRPVLGNTPKVAKVNISFIGDKFDYTTTSVGTSGQYLQTKPMASGEYVINFKFPEGKEKMWLGSTDYPIGTVYHRSQNPLVYLSLPYQQGDMSVTVLAMAYNDNEVLQDWTTVDMTEAGTLKAKMNENLRIRTTKLRINGVMNSYDFDYIRNEMPLIKHLDLENARIVPDFRNYNEDYIPDYALMRKRLDSIILPKSLKGIGLEALRANSFSKIELPATLEYLGLGAFYEEGDVDLMDVYCYNPVPPTIQGGQAGNEENMFQSSTYSRATLWVPAGSKNDYLSQPFVWHNFINVKEFKPAGIDEILPNECNNLIEIYNLQGIRLYSGEKRQSYNLPSGIYICKRGAVAKRIFLQD